MEIRCQAILFDMDGTLVNSAVAVERIWAAWCRRHGIDFDKVFPHMHGRRGIDVITELAPHLDREREAAQLEAEETALRDGIVAIPGAAAFLAGLPAERWCVVTSASCDLARSRLTAANGAELQMDFGVMSLAAPKATPSSIAGHDIPPHALYVLTIRN